MNKFQHKPVAGSAVDQQALVAEIRRSHWLLRRLIKDKRLQMTDEQIDDYAARYGRELWCIIWRQQELPFNDEEIAELVRQCGY